MRKKTEVVPPAVAVPVIQYGRQKPDTVDPRQLDLDFPEDDFDAQDEDHA